jgi:hypothetical protein
MFAQDRRLAQDHRGASQAHRGGSMTLIRAALVALILSSVAAVAEPAKGVPRVGVLWPNPPATFEPIRQRLIELGYAEGRNISFGTDGRKAGSVTCRSWPPSSSG